MMTFQNHHPHQKIILVTSLISEPIETLHNGNRELNRRLFLLSIIRRRHSESGQCHDQSTSMAHHHHLGHLTTVICERISSASHLRL